jgi:hypothetical protein
MKIDVSSRIFLLWNAYFCWDVRHARVLVLLINKGFILGRFSIENGRYVSTQFILGPLPQTWPKARGRLPGRAL